MRYVEVPPNELRGGDLLWMRAALQADGPDVWLSVEVREVTNTFAVVVPFGVVTTVELRFMEGRSGLYRKFLHDEDAPVPTGDCSTVFVGK